MTAPHCAANAEEHEVACCADTEPDGVDYPGWQTSTEALCVTGIWALRSPDNVSCERLAQIVGHLFSNYTYSLYLATTVHVDVLSFRLCAEVLLLKCDALMQSYSKITSGTCSSNGFFPVTTLNECSVAAAAIGYADGYRLSAIEKTGTQRPDGCYEKNGELWLATNTANIGNGAGESWFPICRHTAGTKFMDALSRLQ